ncbi:MAG: hypothetical protein M3O33_21680 [Cyanobacteriota bacterium]|nr:hypothetical protein [Cyanobacteriota bacterium]
MIISDLEYLEVVCEENQIEGGIASVAGAAASASAIGTNTASFSVGTTTLTSLSQSFFPFFPRNLAFSFSQAISRASAS